MLGGGTRRIWGSFPWGERGPRPALPSHIHPADCHPWRPRHGVPVPLPDLQGPFHPAPPPACLSGPAPCTPRSPSSPAFTDPSTLQTPIPAGPPSWPPLLLRLSSPHCLSGPALSTSITSAVTSCPGEGQCQPPFTDGETEAREASDCLRSLQEVGVQRLGPSAAWKALTLTLSSPPPFPVSSPLD